jgi:hypothetical protein
VIEVTSTRKGIVLSTLIAVTRGSTNVVRIGGFKADGSVKPCDAVKLYSDEVTLNQATQGDAWFGILDYDDSLDWGATKPNIDTAYPNGTVGLKVIVSGPCQGRLDATYIPDSSQAGTPLEPRTSGMLGVYVGSGYQHAKLLDRVAGNGGDERAEVLLQ